MPGVLTHTRITWAFSPPAPQVPGVTPGSPLCPWCFGHHFGEVRDTLPLTKHKYKTRTSSYIFLFAPLKLNFIALSKNEQVHNVEDIASKLGVLLTSLPH
jgi:hypothetical protein